MPVYGQGWQPDRKKLRPVENMVNATGAGDAFTAALIYSYVNGFDIDKTIDYALAAGVAAVSPRKDNKPEYERFAFGKNIEGEKNMTQKDYLSITPEIQQAIDEGKPVVALESTILSHGMPFPRTWNSPTRLRRS